MAKLLRVELKKYQVEGVKWLLEKELGTEIDGSKIKGGILADEMGLGKTIQILSLIISNPKPHTLIVLPRALLEQWQTAIQTFINHNPLIFHSLGNTPLSQISLQNLVDSPIILTTYGLLHSYPLRQIKWDRIVFDEAHHLRNHNTKTFKFARLLSSHSTWLVTGTPIQNKLRDFYALCAILNIPESFYVNPTNLPSIVNLFILKRTKSQVGLHLPPLNNHVIQVPWKSHTERHLAEHLHQSLPFSNIHTNYNPFSNILDSSPLPFLTYARQACILPSLLSKLIQQLQDDPLFQQDEQLQDALLHSSKLDALIDTIILRKHNKQHKIIFCHYRGEIDFIQNSLIKHNLSVQTFDGRVPQSKRAHILTNPSDVLILQIKTGCEGLNLQHFSEVYFVSPHWNPAVEDQAVARCYRLGQDKPVSVFRFKMDNLADDTSVNIEQYTLSVQDSKRDVMLLLN